MSVVFGVWFGRRVEKCMHITWAQDLKFMERYPSYAASKTLSMLNLPKRLAVRMRNQSVSMLSLSFMSSRSVSILSIP